MKTGNLLLATALIILISVCASGCVSESTNPVSGKWIANINNAESIILIGDNNIGYVTLAGNETQKIPFRITPKNAGSYEITFADNTAIPCTVNADNSILTIGTAVYVKESKKDEYSLFK